jgi:PAS domain S-box-containing protein
MKRQKTWLRLIKTTGYERPLPTPNAKDSRTSAEQHHEKGALGMSFAALSVTRRRARGKAVHPATPSQPFHVGFSYFEEPFLWAMVAHELTEGAAKLGIETTIKGSRRVEDQVRAVESLIRHGVDAIVISPIVPEIPELLPSLKRAKSKGIVVLLAGVELHGAESLPILRADNPTGQTKIAEHVFQYLGGQGKVAYIRARGSTMPNTLRVNAFYEVLSRYPGIELVRDIVRDSTPLQIKAGVAPMGGMWAREIVREHPDVRAILTPHDSIALGAIDFLQREGIAKNVIVTGFDGTPAGLKSIQQGQLFATIAMPAVDMAHHILHYAVTLAKGKRVPGHTLLPVNLVTRANIADAAASTLLFLPGMIEMQQELLSTVRMNEERLRSLVELVSDWYWEQDHEFRFVANEGDAGVFGSHVGVKLWEIPQLEAPEERWRELRELLQAHSEFYDFELKHVDADGIVRYITMSGRPIYDKKGEFCGYQGVAKDITERRRSEGPVLVLARQNAPAAHPGGTRLARIKRALAKLFSFRDAPAR